MKKSVIAFKSLGKKSNSAHLNNKLIFGGANKEKNKKTEKNKTVKDDKLDKVKVNGILSKSSVFGIVWNCLYENKTCVLKMVLLSEGDYLNKNSFKHNDSEPYLHKEFYNRRTMTREKFLDEVEKTKHLHSLGLAPKIYKYWINDKSFNVHYGLIIIKKMDCTIRHILMKRDLTVKENVLIKNFINNLHIKHGIAHGDLKPANMGVYLDKNQRIRECVAIDCDKVTYRKDLSAAEFKKRINRDWWSYNRQKRANLSALTKVKASTFG